MLSFVRRTCRANFNVEVSKLLYTSLVRSNLEFASIIWSPHQKVHRNFIESVQKQAVIFLNKDYINRSDNEYVLAPYSERCAKFELKSLIRRRLEAAVIFIHKIIWGGYMAPAIRNEISVTRGIRTLRKPEFIRIKLCRTDYALNSPFNTACRAYNHAAMLIDPTLPLAEFTKKLREVPDCLFGDLCHL